MWAVRYLLILALLVVVLGFAVLNSSQKVSIFMPDREIPAVPLTLIILCAFCVGILVSFVLTIAQSLKMSAEMRSSRKRVQHLEMELAALRNRSLEDIDKLEESEVKHE
jgi:uncharacterized integral membrane protein